MLRKHELQHQQHTLNEHNTSMDPSTLHPQRIHQQLYTD